MKAKLMFVHALSPLHAGIGQGAGVIDLPIAREKATGLPYLPGSSVKGVLRDQSDDQDQEMCKKIFGPDTANADDYAGSAQFTDQRLLLLPVRSVKGTFAWVTSPYLLHRLGRDAQDVTLTKPLPQTVPTPPASTHDATYCLVMSGADCALKIENKVILEELDLKVSNQPGVDEWATWLAEHIFPTDETWQDYLKARLCIVHDDTLSFLLDTAIEVMARIVLKDDTKTVSNLWYEEALPAETILSGLVVATPTKKFKLAPADIFTTINGLLNQTLQFGGNATVGRGLCQVRLV